MIESFNQTDKLFQKTYLLVSLQTTYRPITLKYFFLLVKERITGY